MSIALSSPITGGAQTGLTSPTYTHVADTAPQPNGKQYAVTALGGTQTGVVAHSVSSPFTIAFWKPLFFRAMGRINSNGILVGNPKNTVSVITRKGVTPLAGQASEVMVVETKIHCPAGSETNDSNNVKAALSAHIGSLSQVGSGLGDMVKDGIL